MNKWLNALGISQKANKVVSGKRVLQEVRNNNVYLVLVASDAGKNTKKQLFDKTKYYNIPCYELCDSNLLSKAIGKNNRMYVGVIDPSLAEMVIKKIKEE